MKTITFASWCLLGLYTAILLGLILFSRSGSSNDRMAGGFLMMLFVPIIILAGINLLPYKFTHILVLVVCLFPAVGGVLMLIASPIVKSVRERIWANEDAARANGSYYFKDPQRRELAADIASFNIERLRADLQQPVPELNNAGLEQITLFDFAAKQCLKTDPAKAIACFDILLKNGAKIDNGDPAHTPTHFQVLEYDPSVLKWFLENGADANAHTAAGQYGIYEPILNAAVSSGGTKTPLAVKMEKVRLLLDHGANPDGDTPKPGETVVAIVPLANAASRENWALCHMLMDRGANIHLEPLGGSTITETVEERLKYYRSWNKVPSEELILLAKRLNVPVTSDTTQ